MDRGDARLGKELSAGDEAVAALFQLRHDGLQRFHGVDVPLHIVQEDDLAVLGIAEPGR